jgi:hypothetical protein
MMGVIVITELEDNYLKSLASIIEFRCNNISETLISLESDIKLLHESENDASRDKICENIYLKMEYIEILLSKNIDDVMSAEIVEMDKNTSDINYSKDNGDHYYQ